MLYTPLLSLLGATFALGSLSHQNPPSQLQWDVYLAPTTPVNDTVPNLSFSPTAFTLIHGSHSAILVDAPITIDATNKLADWIEQTIPGKKLTHVYITHGHGDHFFGVPVLQQRFPGLKAIATSHTIDHVAEQIEVGFFSTFWEPLFPGQIATQNEVIEALPENDRIELEGNILQVVEVGQSDTYNTTVLHVPSLSLVVTGDAVYGSCFQYLMESNTTALRAQWIHAIDEIESLGAQNVVPSHKQASEGYGTNHFEETRGYIRAWEREIAVAANAKDLEQRMRVLYPGRIGEFILRLSAEQGIPS